MVAPSAPEPGAGATLGASPVRVAVRVRPTGLGQTGNVVLADGHVGSAIRVQNEELGVSSGFDFDAVLGSECGQQEAYEACGKPVLDAVLQGRRGCLMAYGQSGAGKTWSMLGADAGPNSGVVPLLAIELFRRLTPLNADLMGLGGKISVTASYFEVVAGVEHQVYDLLGGAGKAAPLPVKSIGEGFEPKGLKGVLVRSSKDVRELIAKGAEVRTAAKNPTATGRTHTFLTLQLERATPAGRAADRVQRAFEFFDKDSSGSISGKELQKALAALGMASDWETVQATMKKYDTSCNGDLELGEFSGLVDELEERAAKMSSGKMTLVDLAASESLSNPGDDSGLSKALSPGGDHFGLLALGKVLSALAGGRTHVPYREATLTKLLQQAPPPSSSPDPQPNPSPSPGPQPKP